jgi:hypothetical protein
MKESTYPLFSVESKMALSRNLSEPKSGEAQKRQISVKQPSKSIQPLLNAYAIMNRSKGGSTCPKKALREQPTVLMFAANANQFVAKTQNHP